MRTMSTLFQSYGDSEMWRKTPGGVTDWSSKFLDTSVTGSIQQAQCDSSRTVLSLNGGMCENATASLAQPTNEWNSSSMYARTCDGYEENGGAFNRLQFCVFSSTVITMPSCSSLYAWMIFRRLSPVSSCASRNVGPRPCSHQKAKMNARTFLASSVNSKAGTFCGTSFPPGVARDRLTAPGSLASHPARDNT